MPLPGLQVYGSAFLRGHAAGAKPVTSRQLRSSRKHGFAAALSPRHPDVQDMPLWLHGTPGRMVLSVDEEEVLIPVPPVARSRTPAAPRFRVPERPAPIPHGLLGEGDAARGHQLFDITGAEAKAGIQPCLVWHEPLARQRCGPPAGPGGGGWWAVTGVALVPQGKRGNQDRRTRP
jgi:hypothetical protein